MNPVQDPKLGVVMKKKAIAMKETYALTSGSVLLLGISRDFFFICFAQS